MQIDLDSEKNSSQKELDDLLNLRSTKTESKDQKEKKSHTKVKIAVSSNQWTYLINKVETLQPKALRSGVEGILRMDKSYKTIQ